MARTWAGLGAGLKSEDQNNGSPKGLEVDADVEPLDDPGDFDARSWYGSMLDDVIEDDFTRNAPSLEMPVFFSSASV